MCICQQFIEVLRSNESWMTWDTVYFYCTWTVYLVNSQMGNTCELVKCESSIFGAIFVWYMVVNLKFVTDLTTLIFLLFILLPESLQFHRTVWGSLALKNNQGSCCLSEICVSWCETLRILCQQYKKSIQHNLEFSTQTQPNWWCSWSVMINWTHENIKKKVCLCAKNW